MSIVGYWRSQRNALICRRWKVEAAHVDELLLACRHWTCRGDTHRIDHKRTAKLLANERCVDCSCWLVQCFGKCLRKRPSKRASLRTRRYGGAYLPSDGKIVVRRRRIVTRGSESSHTTPPGSASPCHDIVHHRLGDGRAAVGDFGFLHVLAADREDGRHAQQAEREDAHRDEHLGEARCRGEGESRESRVEWSRVRAQLRTGFSAPRLLDSSILDPHNLQLTTDN